MNDEANVSRALNMALPVEYPTVIFDDLLQRVANTGAMEAERKTLISSWQAVAVRYRAAVEADGQARESIARSSNPSGEDRYLQEKAIFDFFVNIASCIDCLFYFMHIIGSVLKPSAFPTQTEKELQQIHPSAVAERFQKHFPAEAVTKLIVEFANSDEYRQSRELKDAMFHRLVPSKTVWITFSTPQNGTTPKPPSIPSNPKSPADQWVHDLDVDDRLTGRVADWVRKEVPKIIALLYALTVSHFPDP